MKVLTEEKTAMILQRKVVNATRATCQKYAEAYGINSHLLISVFVIETYYRPRWQRIIEYFVVFIGCIRCLLFNAPIKNYTIGKCQLGLSTILNFYGSNYYQHARTIIISSFAEMQQLLTSCTTEKSIEILAFRLKPLVIKAKKIYPDNNKSRLRYIGEQYNGRFSYGLLLTTVFEQIKEIV